MRLLLMAIAVISAPALADEKSPASDKPDEKVICKRIETPETGSRLARPTKKCMTASEWKAYEAEKNRLINRSNDISGL